MDKRRDIFIKLDKIKKIVENLTNIEKKENELKELFYNYDSLNSQEGKIFENWSFYLEDINEKIDHVTL